MASLLCWRQKLEFWRGTSNSILYKSFSAAYQVIFTCVPGRFHLRTRSCSLAYQVVFSGAASHFHFAPSFYSCGTSSVFWRHKSLSLRYKSCNFNRQVKITTLQVLILAQQVTFSGIQVTFTCRAYMKE